MESGEWAVLFLFMNLILHELLLFQREKVFFGFFFFFLVLKELVWPKCLFKFLHNMLHKNLNEHFGQPNNRK